MNATETIREAARDARVVARSDVVVVGGGPAGMAAAVAAARNGASVTLLERYPYLGGLAAGGMVLVLDDMHNGREISVRGLAMEMVDRMAKWGLAVYPPESERSTDIRATEAAWRKWSRLENPVRVLSAAPKTRHGMLPTGLNASSCKNISVNNIAA